MLYISDAKSYSSLFFEEDVQQMLQKITNVDLEKVFKPKPRGKPLRPYIYKFLTTEELEEEQKKAKKKLRHLLQMPPVLKPREDINDVLSVDSALDGHDLDHAKFVFSDISFDMSNEVLNCIQSFVQQYITTNIFYLFYDINFRKDQLLLENQMGF